MRAHHCRELRLWRYESKCSEIEKYLRASVSATWSINIWALRWISLFIRAVCSTESCSSPNDSVSISSTQYLEVIYHIFLIFLFCNGRSNFVGGDRWITRLAFASYTNLIVWFRACLAFPRDQEESYLVLRANCRSPSYFDQYFVFFTSSSVTLSNINKWHELGD